MVPRVYRTLPIYFGLSVLFYFVRSRVLSIYLLVSINLRNIAVLIILDTLGYDYFPDIAVIEFNLPLI